MITTLIFDLSEVFFQGMKGTEGRLNKKYGTKLNNSTFMLSKAAVQFFHGEITEDMFWEEIIKEFRLPNTVKDLKELVRENFIEIDGTRGIVERLRKNGYRLGILSVNSKEWVDYFEENFNFHKLFDLRMYSYEVAVSKPDREAYELFLKKSNSTSEECIFIDDSEINLISARQIGMETIQFLTAKQLESDLKKLHIRV